MSFFWSHSKLFVKPFFLFIAHPKELLKKREAAAGCSRDFHMSRSQNNLPHHIPSFRVFGVLPGCRPRFTLNRVSCSRCEMPGFKAKETDLQTCKDQDEKKTRTRVPSLSGGRVMSMLPPHTRSPPAIRPQRRRRRARSRPALGNDLSSTRARRKMPGLKMQALSRRVHNPQSNATKAHKATIMTTVRASSREHQQAAARHSSPAHSSARVALTTPLPQRRARARVQNQECRRARKPLPPRALATDALPPHHLLLTHPPARQ